MSQSHCYTDKHTHIYQSATATETNTPHVTVPLLYKQTNHTLQSHCYRDKHITCHSPTAIETNTPNMSQHYCYRYKHVTQVTVLLLKRQTHHICHNATATETSTPHVSKSHCYRDKHTHMSQYCREASFLCMLYYVFLLLIIISRRSLCTKVQH